MKNKNYFSAVAMIIIALVILFGGVTVILTNKGLGGMEGITSTSAARVSKGQLESLPAPDPHYQKNGMAAITGVHDISPKQKSDSKTLSENIQAAKSSKNNEIEVHQYVIS